MCPVRELRQTGYTHPWRDQKPGLRSFRWRRERKHQWLLRPQRTALAPARSMQVAELGIGFDAWDECDWSGHLNRCREVKRARRGMSPIDLPRKRKIRQWMKGSVKCSSLEKPRARQTETMSAAPVGNSRSQFK